MPQEQVHLNMMKDGFGRMQKSVHELGIVAKVKKLLMLADNTSSKFEAGAALKKAYDLLAEHNLTISDIDMQGDSKSSCVELEHELSSASFPWWKRHLLSCLCGCFSVNMIRSGSFVMTENRSGASQTKKRTVLRIVGVEPDVSIAKYVLEYLLGVLRRAKGAPKGVRNREAWRKGFVISVAERLHSYVEQRRQADCHEKALVVAKETIIENYMNSKYRDIPAAIHRQIRRAQPASFFQGLEAGKIVPLSQPLEQCLNQAQLYN